MLEGLDSIGWSQLSHAYGPATDVPALLRALASGNDKARDEALSELFHNIWHQGTVYEATSFAVPFLVELACARSNPGRADVLGLLGAIAESDDGHRAPHEEALKHTDAIGTLLADDDPLVRAGAAYVLGGLKEQATTTAPQIRNAIERDDDALARAGLLLGLAALAHSEAANISWLERHFVDVADDRERFATAAALAHSARDATPESAIRLLAEACANPSLNSSRFVGLRWDVVGETMPRRALVAAGTAANRGLPILLEALKKAEATDATFVLEDLLSIVLGEPPTHPTTGYDARQREVLWAIAGTPVVWSEPNRFSTILRYYKLPTTRAGVAAAASRDERS